MTSIKIDAFKDRFTESSLDATLWTANTTGGASCSLNGETVVLTVGTSTSKAGIGSVTAFDLTSSEATVELVSPGDITQHLETTFALTSDSGGGNLDGNFVTFKIADAINSGSPGMYASYYNGGSETRVTTSSYSASLQRFLRFREVAGTVYWDTSPDGVTWVNYTSMASPFDLTSVYLELATDNYSTRTTGTSGVFANVGVVPESDKTLSPGMGTV